MVGRTDWEETVKAVIRRDGNRCHACGSPKNLDVHHIIPRRISNNDSCDNLVTLCSSCHKKIENMFLRYGRTHFVDRMLEDARKGSLVSEDAKAI